MFDILPSDDHHAIDKMITESLKVHNDDFITAPYVEDKFSFVARDKDGNVCGGLTGYIVWEWMSVNLLATDKDYRGNGVGSALMAKAEELARSKNCIGMKLVTLDFQAPEFYKKLGFEVLSVMPDYPRGHKRYAMMKRLDNHE